MPRKAGSSKHFDAVQHEIVFEVDVPGMHMTSAMCCVGGMHVTLEQFSCACMCTRMHGTSSLLMDGVLRLQRHRRCTGAVLTKRPLRLAIPQSAVPAWISARAEFHAT